ncbi:MAG: hypothetical protein CMJ17_03950 [Phenylobacterium sp.]|nr:hypothetical protein [Phenylobacterium sp.]
MIKILMSLLNNKVVKNGIKLIQEQELKCKAQEQIDLNFLFLHLLKTLWVLCISYYQKEKMVIEL